MKLAELRAKIKNSPQPQVRSLNCQKSACPQLFSLAGNCDLRTCGLTCGLDQLWQLRVWGDRFRIKDKQD